MLNDLISASAGGSSSHPLSDFGAPFFRCLGVDGTTCYYQPADVADVIELAASAHSKNNLLVLAPLRWWEAQFPSRTGLNLDAAVDACIRASKHQGKFNRERIFGRGVYMDAGRVVAHLGDRLFVDGAATGLDLKDTDRVYVEGPRIGSLLNLAPLASSEARRIPDLIERFNWTEPGMGRLLTGWCVVAPLCGMLNWRSHIWINGAAGSGKSTILKHVVAPMLGTFGVHVQGTTTEAGVRQSLGYDARPVVFDEAEPQGDAGRARMEAIIELARASSSDGAPIVKGSAGGQSQRFRIQSMFAFASIDSAISRRADDSRTIKLGLTAPSATGTAQDKLRAEADFARLKAEVQALFAPGFAERLFARTLSLAFTITHNAGAFSAAIAARVGDARLGDTLGALLAGWYSLSSSKALDFDAASQKLDEWGGWLGVAIETNRAPADCHAALAYLMAKTIRLDNGGERSIEQLVQDAAGWSMNGSTEAQDLLYRHGMRVDTTNGLRLLIGNQHHFPAERLFQGSNWNLKTIDGHPAVSPSGKHTARFPGRPMKYRAVDVAGLLRDEFPAPE